MPPIAEGLMVDASVGAPTEASASAAPASVVAASVGKRTVSGALWTLVSFGASRGLSFGANLVLARLLSPADFGLVSFAMIAIGLCSLLQDLGVPAAIVYGKHDAKAVAGTALTINLVAAVILLAGVIVGAPFMVALSGDATTAQILVALALGLIISAAGSVQEAFLVKELAFRRKVIPEVAPLMVSGIVSITAAVLGFGVWSLVYGYLARAATSTVLLWVVSSVRPRPRWNWPLAVDLLRYGRHISFNSLVGVLASNVDYLIIGSLLGSAQLGLYTMAFVIAGFPSVLAGEAVAKTTFPAYSRLQGNVELVVDLFRDVFTLTCGLCIPAGIALYILAPAFTTIVLGPKWADAVEPLQLLVAYGALRSIVYTFQPLYKAVGRPDIVWKLNVVRLVILAPAMWWSVRDGIAGVAAVQAVIYAVMIPLNGVWLASTVGLPLRGLGRLLLPHTVAGTAACGLVWLVQRSQLGERAVLNPIGSMVVTALAMVTFLGVVALLSPRAVALMRAGLGAISGWQRGAPLSLAWTARRAL